jgi:DNA invertase Pin-like site-specific DNA recombinase
MKQRRVAFYVRVSTDGQTIENQLQELQAVANRHNWDVVKVFKDEGISGSKGRDKRPGFDELCKGIARKDFDMVAAWAVDRLGRSLQDLIAFLSDMNAKGIDLYLHQQGIDTTIPSGKAMFQMLGVFAEFERAMIQERVKAGLQRAKAAGKVLGRPSVSVDTKSRILELKAEGKGIRKIASELHTGVGTVTRILQEQISSITS